MAGTSTGLWGPCIIHQAFKEHKPPQPSKAASAAKLGKHEMGQSWASKAAEDQAAHPAQPEVTYLDTGHVLGEAFIFFADLEGELPRMAHDQDCHLRGRWKRDTQGSVPSPTSARVHTSALPRGPMPTGPLSLKGACQTAPHTASRWKVQRRCPTFSPPFACHSLPTALQLTRPSPAASIHSET